MEKFHNIIVRVIFCNQRRREARANEKRAGTGTLNPCLPPPTVNNISNHNEILHAITGVSIASSRKIVFIISGILM